MIRIATIDDLDLVVKLGQEFIKEAGYEDITEASRYETIAKDFLTGDVTQKVVFLYEDKGILAGMLLPTVFGTKLLASELIWWVASEERNSEIGSKLLEAFEYWGKQVGASYINMTCLTENVEKFYKKNGYSLFQRVYLKEVK